MGQCRRDGSQNNPLLSARNSLQISGNSRRFFRPIRSFRAFPQRAGYVETRIIRYILPQDQGGVAVCFSWLLPAAFRVSGRRSWRRRSNFETRNVPTSVLPVFADLPALCQPYSALCRRLTLRPGLPAGRPGADLRSGRNSGAGSPAVWMPSFRDSKDSTSLVRRDESLEIGFYSRLEMSRISRDLSRITGNV